MTVSHPGLVGSQFQQRAFSETQTGDERVTAHRGCMLALVQVPISPQERWSEIMHMYNNGERSTTHTNTGTVSQHLCAVPFIYLFVFLCTHLDI